MRFEIRYDYDRELADMLPPYYRDYKESDEYLRASDEEFARLYGNLSEVASQGYVELATWGIDMWEDMFGISKDNRDYPLEFRRKRIISMIHGTDVSSKKNLENLINGLAGVSGAKLTEDNPNYSFLTEIPIEDSFLISEIERIIDIYKPAHLGHLTVTYRKDPVYMATIQLSGEETTVLPYMIEDREISGKLKQGTATYTQEITEIHPLQN